MWQTLLSGALLRPMVDVDLVATPGAAFNYSNLSSHWLGVIVARACESDLRSFAEERLMGPLGAQLGEWTRDRAGYYLGFAEMRLTPLDLAKFGQMYLDGGLFGGNQVVPSEWVRDSLRAYSSDAWVAQPPQNHAGRYFRRLGYGYQWWSARIGDEEVDFAWGHGGQLIVLLDSLDVVVVATSRPFVGQHDAEAWKHERATLNLVGKFVQSLADEL